MELLACADAGVFFFLNFWVDGKVYGACVHPSKGLRIVINYSR